jgi:hypothetical protein
MRAPIYVLAAIGVLAVAAPASALTTQPVSATTAGPVVNALKSDPVSGFLGAGAGFRWSVAGDDSAVGGLPVYFEPTDAAAKADQERYAADPVGFMDKADVRPVAEVAHKPSAVTAPKAPTTGR